MLARKQSNWQKRGLGIRTRKCATQHHSCPVCAAHGYIASFHIFFAFSPSPSRLARCFLFPLSCTGMEPWFQHYGLRKRVVRFTALAAVPWSGNVFFRHLFHSVSGFSISFFPPLYMSSSLFFSLVFSLRTTKIYKKKTKKKTNIIN